MELNQINSLNRFCFCGAYNAPVRVFECISFSTIYAFELVMGKVGKNPE